MTARHGTNSTDFSLQIVSNTGDPYHSMPGSEGLKDQLGLDGLIEELYGSGLYFYYAPAEGSLVCYFQGIRNVSEQLYVLYRGTPGPDFFETFWRRFEQAIQESNIEVNENASGSHEVFSNLRSGTQAVAELSVPELLEQKQNPEVPTPVTLGTPDYESAVGVVNWMLDETTEDLDVAIGGLGWVDDYLSTDVLVQPRGSDSVGTPIEETRNHLDRIDLSNRIEETRKTVEEATQSALGNKESLKAFADQLNDAGLRELGLVAFAEAKRDRFASYRTGVAVASFGLGVLGVFLLAVFFDVLDPIVVVLTADYPVVFVGATPVWIIVLLSVISVGASLVVELNAVQIFGSAGDNLKNTRGRGVDKSRVRGIITQLNEIKTHDRTGTGSFSEFETLAVDRIFTDSRLNVRTTEAVQRAQRLQILVDAGFGLVGAIGVATTFGLVAVLLQQYQSVMVQFFLLLGVAGGVGVGYRSAGFLARGLDGKFGGLSGPSLRTVGATWLPFVIGFSLLVDSALQFWLSTRSPTEVLFTISTYNLQYGDLASVAIFVVGVAVGFASLEFGRTDEYRFFGPPLGALAGMGLLAQAAPLGALTGVGFFAQAGLPLPGVIAAGGAAVGGLLFGVVARGILAFIGVSTTWITAQGSAAVLILAGIGLLVQTHVSPELGATVQAAPLRAVTDAVGLALLIVGGVFVQGSAQRSVFILGPPWGNPYLPLLHVMKVKDATANPKLIATNRRFSDQTDPFGPYERSPNGDKTEMFLLQLDLPMDKRDIRLRTTIHEPGLIDADFATRLENLRRIGRKPQDSERLDSGRASGLFSSADRTERQTALAYEVLDSDVVVLTFPIDTVNRVMAQEQSDTPNQAQVRACLKAYRILLEVLPEDHLVYGLGTDLDSYTQQEGHPPAGRNEWERFRSEITQEMDEHLSLKGGLQTRLDDEDSSLYPVWSNKDKIEGADRFLQDINPSRKR